MIRRTFCAIIGLAMLSLLSLPRSVFALGETGYVENTAGAGDFPAVQGSDTAAIYVDAKDWPGVIRAAGDLQEDVNRVTGKKPTLGNDLAVAGKTPIIIGTLGKSAIIDQLIQSGKIDVTPIRDKWESYFLQVVPNAMDGVSNALVIVGSDKRGTIYGIYDLSQQMGVSPWYFWADVPTPHQDAVFVKPGKYVQGPPAVKYRGIFFNDESPDLSGWVREKYGAVPNMPNVANYSSQFYSTVFELLLRLKGNYLWPAMWNNAFNEDDPQNPVLADEYGIVMGTSHQEPMLRAQKEWDRRHRQPWNYYKDAKTLQDFWREGIKRNKDYESILTIGLRGANDTPMIPNATVQQSMNLLKEIIDEQRKMITEEINPDPSKVPQLWCPYKEVLEYYNQGFRVPDDVTILWTDDNWGNIRRLPTEDERKRSGGAGIYYHFDYVGGPRNYKWINTNPIPKVWEQMNLALQYGADRIWIVNVGSLKGKDFSTEFFLQFGFNPQRWPKEKLGEFTKLWAQREFGPEYADDIADIISKTLKYNGRRKPELLDPSIFSVVDYQEADSVLADFKALVAKAEEISAKLPEEKRAAFFEQVLDPAKANEQVTELYIDAARNKLYATQGRASANDFGADVTTMFKADQALSDYYNHTLLNGRWDHMMDQIHIGYTTWQDPRRNKAPTTQPVEVSSEATMGVAIQGSISAWPGAKEDAVLPTLDSFNQPKRYIDVFNRGARPFDFTSTASDPWIVLSQSQGTIDRESRIWVSVDWSKAPSGSAGGSVKIAQTGGDSVTVKVNCFNPADVTRDSLQGFVEADGVVSMEAEHYSNKINAGAAKWEKLPDYGRTLSAMSIFPVTATSVNPPQDSPCLEYRMYLFDPGNVTVNSLVAPSLGFVPGRGLRFAVSFDDQPPQVLDVLAHNSQRDWENSVKDNIRVIPSTHTLDKAGYHTLKIWMVDPSVVLEKIVVDAGGLKQSYFGPPESYSHENKTPQ